MNDQIERLKERLATIRGTDPISKARRAAIQRQIWALEAAGGDQ